MTNPKNKKTREQFIEEIPKELGITIVGEYVNTDTKIEYRCKHGINAVRPHRILKLKHCCREGYYESGKMWESNTNDLETLRERALKNRKNIDVSETYLDTSGRYKRLENIKCLKHNIYYGCNANAKVGICSECLKEANESKLKKAQEAAWRSEKTGSFVSKSETKWLDELKVSRRQFWLEDVKYKVDGYDPETNTVYLYHGRFWHGCPETFDQDMIHPVVKLPMRDLYEKTIFYENKIKDAGYKLVVKWGR